ncbi:MAG: hypothetical protein NC548_33980 [Lachnospiraceae bacterium]|nr:hypothetical protein [Lachnospiraceae bacterium]
MSKKKKTEFEESLLWNMNSYRYYLDVLTELCLSQFTWNNLPESVDERYMELKLFMNGSVVYFNDEVMGNLCLSCIPQGDLDVYGVPVYREAWSGFNRYSKSLSNEDSVIIWNNMLHQNSTFICELYARRLWLYDRICDVNTNTQKTPILIIADENERLSMLNLYKEYDGNSPVIFGTKSLNTKGITALQTGAEYVAPAIYDMKTRIWNECLTYLGISNIPVVKKGNVTNNEFSKSLGGTYGSRYARFRCRQIACEKINKMFGTEISVDITENIFQNVEVNSNEQVYNTTENNMRDYGRSDTSRGILTD